MNDLPQYLVRPKEGVRTYGEVTYNEKEDSYFVRAEPAVLELAKRVFPGCEDADDGVVRFPATRRLVGELNWLMLRYPLEINCMNRFLLDRDKAVAHALRRDENLDMPPLTDLPAAFTGKLYPYQEKDAAYLLKNERALLANQMGLGKTVVALAAFAASGARPGIVVVPPNLQLQWRRMAAAFLDVAEPGRGYAQSLIGTDAASTVAEARADATVHVLKGMKPYPLPPRPLYIIHYGLLKAWRAVLFEMGAPLLIFDEIHELRHADTAKYSAASAIASRSRYVWGLSGTPIYNFGHEIWAVTNILDYHALGDYESFTREYCTGYGGKVVENPVALGDWLRREGLMMRRTKEDPEVALHLPPKRHVVHIVEKDEAAYSKLIQEAVRLAKGYASIKDWQAKGLAMRQIEGGVRKASGVAKAPYVAAFVKGLLDAGERVLLCAHHHAVHDILTEELRDYSPVRVSGMEDGAEKDAAVKAFGRVDGPRVILLGLRSAAGLDGLQGRGTCVVFAELDWSPAVLAQSADRLHRIGMNEKLESLLCYYMVSDTGIDETMQEALGIKIGQFVGIMGDRIPGPEDEGLAQMAAERHMGRVIEALKRGG